MRFSTALSALALATAVALPSGFSTAQTTQTVLLPKGAQFEAAFQETLDSGKLQNGYAFTMVEHEGFFHKTPALKGAIIDGHVENVTAAGPTHKATMNVIFDDVKLPDGTTAPLNASVSSIKELEPKTHHLRDTALVLGGAVAGHVASKKTGHGGGTLAGAAAGFALATTLKSNIVLKKGTVIRLKLNSDLTPQPNG